MGARSTAVWPGRPASSSPSSIRTTFSSRSGSRSPCTPLARIAALMLLLRVCRSSTARARSSITPGASRHGPSTRRAATWDCRWSSQRIHDNVEPDRAPPRVRRDRPVRQSVLRPRPGSLLRVVVEGRSIRYVSAPLLRYRIHAVKGALKVKVEWTDVAALHLSRVRSAEAGFYAQSDRIYAIACLQNFRLPPFRRRRRIPRIYSRTTWSVS